MKIAKYVGDLLYNYECVVIPGLGGFLTNDKPATINPSSNLFKPPFKQVLFNAFLKTNDGLLVNYVAREEGLEYKAAKEQVDRFVLLCNNALQEGKRVNFHQIGYLYLNDNQQISFKQDSSVNYNADAFGLTSFISPAVYKQSPEEKLREQIAPQQPVHSEKAVSGHKDSKRKESPRKVEEQRKVVKTHHVASKRRSPYRTQMTVMVVLISVIFVGWGFMNKKQVQKYYSNYSSVIPIFYSSPNAYLVANINSKPVSKLSSSKTGLWIVSLFEKVDNSTAKSSAPLKKSVPVVSKTVEQAPTKTMSKPETGTNVTENKTPSVQPATIKSEVVAKKATPVTTSVNDIKPNQSVTGSGRVYIIAGAFKNKVNAEKLIHKLRLKGYPAVEAGFTKSGLLRVAFGQFHDRNQAERQLLAIRTDENPSAWIFEN